MATNKDNGPEKSYGLVGRRILLTASVGIAVAGSAYLANFAFAPISRQPGHWGALGDYIGGLLNPFIAFLALYALLKIIEIETAGLNLAKRELAAASAAFQEQNRNDRFFKLLDLVNSSSDLFNVATEVDGRPRRLLNRLEAIRGRYKRGDLLPADVPQALFNLETELSQHESYNTLTRTLHTAIDFLIRQNLPDDEKRFYVDALSSVLKDADVFCTALTFATFGREFAELRPAWCEIADIARGRLQNDLKELFELLADATDEGGAGGA